MINTKIEVLSKEEIEKIHLTTLKVFMDPGILVVSEKARQIFRESGCDVDDKTQIVKIPEHVALDAISKAASSFTLYARDDKKSLDMRWDGKNHWTNFGTGVKACDYLGHGKYTTRDSTEQDVCNFAKICDWAEHIDLHHNSVTPTDVCGVGDDVIHRNLSALENTSKHVIGSAQAANMQIYADIMTALYGGDEEEALKKPLFSLAGCPTSPLELGDSICNVLIEAAKINIPVVLISMAMSGGTSPIHLAGTLVTHNAEVMAGVILAQLSNPGSSVLYGCSTTNFDLRKGTAPVGSPELALINAAAGQLAQFYKIPSYVAGT